MSILREVIISVGEIEWNNIRERLPVLIKNVHLCRSEIFSMLDDVYLEFIQKPMKDEHYSNNLLELKKELEVHVSNCEQGIKRETPNSQKYNEFKRLWDQLQSTIEICTEVQSCYYIHEKFVDLQLCRTECEKSLEIMKQIKNSMENGNSSILQKYYRKHFELTKSDLHLRFGDVIRKKFIFEVKDKEHISYIRVERNIDVGNQIQILLHFYENIKQLDELIDFLWEFIFIPIISYVVVMTFSDTEIQIKVLKRSEPHYEDVFKRLQDLILFMKNNFNIYIDSSQSTSLLEYIGIKLKDRISSYLISHCFKNMHTVSDDKAMDYNIVIQQVTALQADLNSAMLVIDDSLLKYATNLRQIHFSKAQDKFLENLKIIMSKKNHDIAKVVLLFPKKYVDNSSSLASMLISSDVKELHELAKKILIEAKKNKILIDTVYNVFRLYRKFTTKNVERMTAQEVALLFNNYTFIAHELRDWNICYSHLIYKTRAVPLFKEESIIFQVVCKEILENYMTKEVGKLRSHLHELSTDDKEFSCEFFESIVKKCLRQIDLLKESWYDLLSHTAFNRSIGVCFGVLCDFLIKFILKFEIIDKPMVNKFSSVFSSILKQSQKYFVNVSDYQQYIKCWSQFQALSTVLKTDSVEVEINKYYEILKSNFQPVEATKIIKAVFNQTGETEAILGQL